MRTLLTLGLGALAMYLLDPEQGRRRRGLLREQWEQGRKKTLPQQTSPGAALEPDKPSETPPSAHHLGR